MARDEFDISWQGLDQMIALLGEMDLAVEREIINEMNRFSKVPERGAKQLAPQDTGDLRDSITASEVRKVGRDYEFSLGTNLTYALKVHENPLNWGEKTRNKGPWRGYQPGEKYLDNAVLGSEKEWNQAMDNVLNKVLGGGRI
ncbi:HK97 gp10 family phage protein [Salinicoccus sp. ID82-1]|uniref:HK97 gp10 family phage protein n=1 Tax=Salinicoccus sp. ID82-1 TaxID=2820269 RepID=UPI001F305B72|nr:HK97 gp10 family phage protein [Salinicoccus sp. ID82-1]MCG1009225.1 HK97 gp10 family phage protein [Salinicoccus sp. ID82-1]